MQSEKQVAQGIWANNRRDIECIRSKLRKLCSELSHSKAVYTEGTLDTLHDLNDAVARKAGITIGWARRETP